MMNHILQKGKLRFREVEQLVQDLGAGKEQSPSQGTAGVKSEPCLLQLPVAEQPSQTATFPVHHALPWPLIPAQSACQLF